MRAYKALRPSGVSWVGEIPAHWEMQRVRFRCRLNPRIRPDLDDEKDVSFLPMEAIGDDGSITVDATRKVKEVASGYTCFEDGDVTIAKITPCFENGKGAVMKGLLGGIGFGTTELIVIRPESAADSNWLYYLTQSEPFRKIGEAMMYGAGGQKRVPDSYVKDLPVAWPPRHEQQAIAAYLDTETSRIAALIFEKNRLIETLREFRQTAISEAITRGLNPLAPMKPSGVPWLDEVPAHWQVKLLKHVADVRSGLAKGKDYADQDTRMLPYLRVANVQDGSLNLDEILQIEVAASAVERYSLQPGDVLMNEGGDFDKLGRGAVWKGTVSPCLHQNHVFAVRPHDIDLSEWISMLTQTAYAKFYFMGKANQSTNLASISQTNIKLLPVLLPPEDERKAILVAVREDLENADRLIEHASQEIALLRELRSATIAAAVLGRIKVC